MTGARSTQAQRPPQPRAQRVSATASDELGAGGGAGARSSTGGRSLSTVPWMRPGPKALVPEREAMAELGIRDLLGCRSFGICSW